MAASATRFEQCAKQSLAKGLTKVVDNQRALEGEARLFKATASNLLTQTAQWASQYQAFCTDVEVGQTGVGCYHRVGDVAPHVSPSLPSKKLGTNKNKRTKAVFGARNIEYVGGATC